VGALADADVALLREDDVVYLTGAAGAVTIHSCRTLHRSAVNRSPNGRPLLLNVYSAADTMAYTPNPIDSQHGGEIVRGHPPRCARHDPRPCHERGRDTDVVLLATGACQQWLRGDPVASSICR
jgi:hypothetical protein